MTGFNGGKLELPFTLILCDLYRWGHIKQLYVEGECNSLHWRTQHVTEQKNSEMYCSAHPDPTLSPTSDVGGRKKLGNYFQMLRQCGSVITVAGLHLYTV